MLEIMHQCLANQRKSSGVEIIENCKYSNRALDNHGGIPVPLLAYQVSHVALGVTLRNWREEGNQYAVKAQTSLAPLS